MQRLSPVPMLEAVSHSCIQLDLFPIILCGSAAPLSIFRGGVCDSLCRPASSRRLHLLGGLLTDPFVGKSDGRGSISNPLILLPALKTL